MSAWKALIDRIAGTWGIEDQGGFPGEPLRQTLDVVATFQKPAVDGAAATATASTKGNAVNGITGSFTNPFDYDLAIIGFTISPNAALTASATDYATINIETDDGADSAPVAGLSVSTTVALPGTGTWATDVSQKVNIMRGGTKGVVGAGTLLPSGGNLFVSIAKTGAGVVVPICTITVLLRRV